MILTPELWLHMAVGEGSTDLGGARTTIWKKSIILYCALHAARVLRESWVLESRPHMFGSWQARVSQNVCTQAIAIELKEDSLANLCPECIRWQCALLPCLPVASCWPPWQSDHRWSITTMTRIHMWRMCMFTRTWNPRVARRRNAVQIGLTMRRLSTAGPRHHAWNGARTVTTETTALWTTTTAKPQVIARSGSACFNWEKLWSLLKKMFAPAKVQGAQKNLHLMVSLDFDRYGERACIWVSNLWTHSHIFSPLTLLET